MQSSAPHRAFVTKFSIAVARNIVQGGGGLRAPPVMDAIPVAVLVDIAFLVMDAPERTSLDNPGAPQAPLPCQRQHRPEPPSTLAAARLGLALVCTRFAAAVRALPAVRILRLALRRRCEAVVRKAVLCQVPDRRAVVQAVQRCLLDVDDVLRKAPEATAAAALRAAAKLRAASGGGGDDAGARCDQLRAYVSGWQPAGACCTELLLHCASRCDAALHLLRSLPGAGRLLYQLLLCEGMLAEQEGGANSVYSHCMTGDDCVRLAVAVSPRRGLQVARSQQLTPSVATCRYALNIGRDVLRVLPLARRVDPDVFGDSCLKRPRLLSAVGRAALRHRAGEHATVEFLIKYAAKHGNVRTYARMVPRQVRESYVLMARAAMAAKAAQGLEHALAVANVAPCAHIRGLVIQRVMQRA